MSSASSDEAWLSTTRATRSTTSGGLDGRATSSTARASTTTLLRERESPDAGLLAAEERAAEPLSPAATKHDKIKSHGQEHHFGFTKPAPPAEPKAVPALPPAHHLYGLANAPRVKFETSLRPAPTLTPTPTPRTFLRARTGRGGGAYVPSYRGGATRRVLTTSLARRPLWGSSRVSRAQPARAPASVPPRPHKLVIAATAHNAGRSGYYGDGDSDAALGAAFNTNGVGNATHRPGLPIAPPLRQKPLLPPPHRSATAPLPPSPPHAALSPRAHTASLANRPVWIPAGIADRSPAFTARPSVELPSPFELGKLEATLPQAPLAAQPHADPWRLVYGAATIFRK